MLNGGEIERGQRIAKGGVGWWRETDVHMHSAMVGDEGPMTGGCVAAEGGEVGGDLFEGGRRWLKDARDDFEAVRVPVVDIVDAVSELGEEGLLAGAHDAGVFADVPIGKVVSFAAIYQTLEVGGGRKKGKRDVQDLVGIGTTAVLVEAVADGCLFARGQKRNGAGQRPTHILGPCDKVVDAAAAEVSPHIVGEFFDNGGARIDALQVVGEEILVEGENALELHPEGELETGGSHCKGGKW